MNFLSEKSFSCPYCGSENSIALDGQGRRFKMVVDCETCCRPIVVGVRVMGGDCELDVRAENE